MSPSGHETDGPILSTKVGYEGESGSGSDIVKPTPLTRSGHAQGDANDHAVGGPSIAW
jgi:hypothetical protein